MGLVGKTYPRPLSKEIRLQIIGYVHRLHHDGLTVREIMVKLSEAQVRRSIGSISSDLTKYHCIECSGATNPPPEQAAN
jgi:hypothetical protein